MNDRVTLDDVAAAHATITGMTFAESVERLQAALRGLAATLKAFDRLSTFRPFDIRDFARRMRSHRIRPRAAWPAGRMPSAWPSATKE